MMQYKHFLLLDDDETMVFFHKSLIAEQYQNAHITGFTNSIDFIDWFKINTDFKKAETLLLMDIDMPEKTGYEVMDELEEIPELLDGLNIILLSASTFKVDHEKATHYPNVIGYIEKPLRIEKLEALISN